MGHPSQEGDMRGTHADRESKRERDSHASPQNFIIMRNHNSTGSTTTFPAAKLCPRQTNIFIAKMEKGIL
jgi:hypothetical protein